MPYVQLVVDQPDICFSACTSGVDGGVEGDRSPVVIVRVAIDRVDVACCIRWPVGPALGFFTCLTPVMEDPVNVIGICCFEHVKNIAE